MRPFTFRRNRVWRVYKGGAMIDRLQRAASPEDGSFPEEWLASCVRACNFGRNDPDEGLSVAVVDGKEIPFHRLAAERAEELFGAPHVRRHGASPGFLTKLLDSAIRLPLQAHPDREAAKRLYNSKFGKTEAWIVIGGRRIGGEDPYVLLGFNESLNEEVFRREALSGEMPESLKMMHKHYARPGDTLMLHGGLPHAIGPGNFILEIMEPTDWVSQPEGLCGEHRLTKEERFGSVDPAASLDIFHYKAASKEEAWAASSLTPRVLDSGEGFELVSLIDRGEFFGAMKLKLSGEWIWRGGSGLGFAVGAVAGGACSVSSQESGAALEIGGGGCFFIPASCESATIKGSAEIVFALPPL